MTRPQELPSGKWRVQKMRAGVMVLDRVFSTKEEAQAAIDKLESREGSVKKFVDLYPR